MSDVEVKPSRIEGLGVFAARPFRAGERIRRVHVVRAITPDAPLREDLGERAEHCSYPDGKTVLFGFPDRHLNHSCDPNAWELYEGCASYLVARRAIAAGEEITCDYNINIANGTAWPCRCGAARCGGTVAGDFFLLPEARQREYRPFLAEWFVRRQRERLAALDRDPQPAHRVRRRGRRARMVRGPSRVAARALGRGDDSHGERVVGAGRRRDRARCRRVR